jgi:hypothetical protein
MALLNSAIVFGENRSGYERVGRGGAFSKRSQFCADQPNSDETV